MKPKISVIMSTYKETEAQLRRSIESILNQTFKDIEFIIIVDNPERKELKKLVNSYANKDKRIKVIVNKKNSGVSFSMNKALRIAKANWVARMDADDFALPKRLERSWAHRNKADIVFCNIVVVNDNGEVIIVSDEKQRAFLSSANGRSRDELVEMMLDGDFIPNPAAMFKKKIGFYDPRFRRCDDYDFWARAIINGHSVYYIDEDLINYTLPYVRYSLDSLGKLKRSALEEAQVLYKYRKEFKKINKFKYYKKICIKLFYYFVGFVLYPLYLIKKFFKNK